MLLQLATITIPGLRTVLGLETIDVAATLLIAGALAVSVIGAFALARSTTEPS